MKVLVLGGAGYIGSHTVYELIASGHDVAVVDSLETGYKEAVHQKARFYQGDIRDRDFLKLVLLKEKPAVVMHFAANSQVEESMREALKYYNNNLYGCMVLLETMKECGVDKIVFSSTAAVYGEPKSIPISEDDICVPESVYGETKLAMEKLMYWCEKSYGLKYIALRYFNAAGAHESGEIGEAHNPETHLIPLVLKAATGARRCVKIFGDDYDTRDGSCVRDYIHVTDLAQAHILAMEYLQEKGESQVFNLGNGLGFTVLEVIKTAEQVVGHSIASELSDRRPGDPAQLVASSEKASQLLGWNPRHNSLEEIIGSAYNWMERHPSGYTGGK